MPLQSGSDAILKAMRRSYRSERFLGILDRVRAQIPDAAITTDIIVGFPGETEQDFQDTLAVVKQSRFAGAFTFQYSPRPGTPAADYPDQVDPETVADRYQRLVAVQELIGYQGMQEQVGKTAEVLLSKGEGRKDGPDQMTGRARDNRLVHLPRHPDAGPGDVVETVITGAAPHYVKAVEILTLRRTRAVEAPGISLGMPKIGAPA
jgi:tRNA-2-methylthio-N6-dimethylallyladenosine synthase